MTISNDDVKSIARLARIKIEESDIPDFAVQLGQILDFVEQMNRIDTEGIEPLAHPSELAAHLRPDEVSETDRREIFQSGAPLVENGLYLVPKVIE